jgi:16S rRNA (uracil1498-N3)-methyltransferase
MTSPVTFFFGRHHSRRFTLDPEDSHHAIRVLRHKPGDVLWCIDGSGPAFEVELERDDPRAAEGSVILAHPDWNEPRVDVHLLTGMTQPVRMDWLIEKATELGVHTILPVKGRYKPGPGRKRRWSRIARSAAKQCQRGRIPDVFEPAPLEDLLGQLPNPSRRVVASLGASLPLVQAENDLAVVLAVGHDSGFSEQESSMLAKAGFHPISLGARRLRTETAVLSALHAIHSDLPHTSTLGQSQAPPEAEIA